MPNPEKHHALVFVPFAHDRRFVGVALFVLAVFISISGRKGSRRSISTLPVDAQARCLVMTGAATLVRVKPG